MSTATSSTVGLVKLISREEVAEGTIAFRFEKPPGWTFKAGQSLDMTLLDPPQTDANGNTRAFSVASAPQEESLMIATRMRDTAFKRVLATFPLGARVRIDGPFGNLILHNNAARTAVFLAGGIGITPFRSIIVHAAKENLPHRILLFFSNRRPEDAPFLEELRALQRHNSNYRMVATMTRMEESHCAWNGETGLMNSAMLSKHLKDVVSPIYYIAGPPGLVTGMREMLSTAGIDDDDIRSEEFGGY